MPDPNSNSVSLTACDVPNTYPEKKPEKPAAAANDNSDGEDADFEEDFDDDDDDDSSSSDDEGADGEVEAEDLEGGAGGHTRHRVGGCGCRHHLRPAFQPATNSLVNALVRSGSGAGRSPPATRLACHSSQTSGGM